VLWKIKDRSSFPALLCCVTFYFVHFRHFYFHLGGIVSGGVIALLQNIDDFLPGLLFADDIEDSSILRRGIPVAHMIYGQVGP
jgi:hypothetical protein